METAFGQLKKGQAFTHFSRPYVKMDVLTDNGNRFNCVSLDDGEADELAQSTRVEIVVVSFSPHDLRLDPLGRTL